LSNYGTEGRKHAEVDHRQTFRNFKRRKGNSGREKTIDRSIYMDGSRDRDVKIGKAVDALRSKFGVDIIQRGTVMKDGLQAARKLKGKQASEQKNINFPKSSKGRVAKCAPLVISTIMICSVPPLGLACITITGSDQTKQVTDGYDLPSVPQAVRYGLYITQRAWRRRALTDSHARTVPSQSG